MKRRLVTAGVIFVSVFVSVPLAWAQLRSTGTIVGIVKDPSGAVIADAAVTLKNTGTGATAQTETSSSGDYTFPVVLIGQYELTATKTGFKQAIVSDVKVSAAENVKVDFVLTLGQVSEHVTVTAAVAAVNTVTADEGNTVSGQQINELPLETRVFTQLLYLEPGAVSSSPKAVGFGSNSLMNYTFNGVRNDGNNYMIDGVRNLDTFGGNAFVTPNLYAMSEFRVENNSYSAITGRSAGGQINLISRAGTNDFHGNVFEYLRNNATNARNFFANQIPEDRYNNFGYDVGGPIKKDKYFFFWSEEWRRIIESGGTRLAIVPTQAERNGDFSALLQGSNPQIIVDPTTGTPFPNNVIPPSKIDPNASILLNTYWPLPIPGYNNGGFNFQASNPDGTRWREESIRLDAKLTDKWSAYARFTGDSVSLYNPFGLFNPNILPTVGASNQAYPLYNWALNVTYVPRPNWVTEIQWGLYYGSDKKLEQTSDSCRCRAPGLNIPKLFPGTNNQNRIPSVTFGQGYAGIVLLWPFHNLSFTQPYQVHNTWVRGHHTIKFGGELSLEGKTEYVNFGQDLTNGAFSFTGQYTGNAIADMVVGRSFSYTESAGNPFDPFRWYNFEPYVEDQVKLRPNLTLTAGLRYSYFEPEYSKSNVLSAFNPSLFDPSKAAKVNPDGTIVPGTQNFSNGIFFPNKNSPYGKFVFNSKHNGFGPRLGLVWDPTSTGKMSLRAGYGVFYDRWGSFAEFSGLNPPFNQQTTVFNANLSNPGGGAGSTPIFPATLYTTLTPWDLPQVQKWSASVERDVWKTKVEAAYVGTKGSHIMGMLNLNQLYPNLQVAQGNISPDSVRPYLGFSNINSFTTNSNTTYHSLQVSAVRRMAHGLAFQVSYTWSKALTDANSQWGPPQDSRNQRADKGLAAWDDPQVLTFNYLWDIPFFGHTNGPVKAIFDGWQLGGITNFQEGFPSNVTLTTDNEGIGGGLERPNRIGNPSGPRTLANWFNTSAFVVPPIATFGNAPNGVVRGPGLNNWDLALSKNIHLKESKVVSLRFQGFNFFNHAQFNGIDTGLGDATFGHVTSAAEPRIVQFGVAVSF